MKTKENLNKGITLVALVITIIILLILAGVAITALTQTGLFENAKQAKNAMENAQNEEESRIAKYTNDIESYVTGNRDYETEINELKTKIEELENLSNYSTDEKVVGTWVDGKKLYNKTIFVELNKGPKVDQWEDLIDLSNLNIDSNNPVIIVCTWSPYGNVNWISSGMFTTNSPSGSIPATPRIITLTYDISTKKIRVISTQDLSNYSPKFYLTIKYTKISD